MRVQTTEKAIIRKEKHLEDDGEVEGDDEVIYKIEVAANRSAGFVLGQRNRCHRVSREGKPGEKSEHENVEQLHHRAPVEYGQYAPVEYGPYGFETQKIN